MRLARKHALLTGAGRGYRARHRTSPAANPLSLVLSYCTTAPPVAAPDRVKVWRRRRRLIRSSVGVKKRRFDCRFRRETMEAR